ncbi:MAG: hypothetical protein NTY25_01350, partial [Planctomycetia bacterium]|nr:hypothetical protein [Planctomycetia bacterium]
MLNSASAINASPAKGYYTSPNTSPLRKQGIPTSTWQTVSQTIDMGNCTVSHSLARRACIAHPKSSP